MKISRLDLRRWFIKGTFWTFHLYLWSILGLLIGGMKWMIQLNLQSLLISFVSCMLLGISSFLLYGIFWSVKYKTRLSLHERAFYRNHPPKEVTPVFNITIALASLVAFFVVLGSNLISLDACGFEMLIPYPQDFILPWLFTALIAGLWSGMYYQIIEWVRLDSEKIKRK